jgi:hypothetical protein
MTRICKNEFTDELRELFDANPLRIPQTGMQPLTILEIDTTKKARFFTEFKLLIDGDFGEPVGIKSEELSGFSMRKSKKVKIGLGLDLLKSYLGAFGVPPGAVEGQIRKDDKFSLSFSNVSRNYFDQVELGRFLYKNDIRINEEFIRMKSPDSKLAIIIDSIVSKDFSISVYDKSDNGVNVSLPAIDESIANVKIEANVSHEAAYDICVKKEYPLTFAFSCKEIQIIDGKIVAGEFIQNARGIGPDMGSSNLLDENMQHGPLLIEIG